MNISPCSTQAPELLRKFISASRVGPSSLTSFLPPRVTPAAPTRHLFLPCDVFSTGYHISFNSYHRPRRFLLPNPHPLTMPPRIPTSWQACAELASSANAASSPLQHALLACRALPSASTPKAFSTSSTQQKRAPNHPKSLYHKWLKSEGRQFVSHTPGQPNYVVRGSEFGPPKPFPFNPTFISQTILSEEAREEIYQRVFTNDEPIKVVSADLNVDHRRVAAVVRMKEIEKEWERQVCLTAFFPLASKTSFSYDDPKQKFD